MKLDVYLAVAALALSAGTAPAAARGLEPLVLRTQVAADPAAVWAAWASQRGVESFFAADAKVEPRIGGAYEIYFLPDQPPGLRGSETATILAMEPPNRLMFSWNAPVRFGPLREQLTVVEIKVEPVRGGQGARVTLTHFGWGEGEKWKAVRGYFAQAWPTVFARLRDSLAPR